MSTGITLTSQQLTDMDAASTFDPNHVEFTWNYFSINTNDYVTAYRMDDGSNWVDLNNNGTKDVHFEYRTVNGEQEMFMDLDLVYNSAYNTRYEADNYF